jgi:hypothetical protein
MCTSMWHSTTVQCTIDEYGVTPPTIATTSSSEQLATTAVVPIQANLSLDVLNSAVTLSQRLNSADKFSSNVVGAIVDLHWNLQAEQYWATKAKQSEPITLALLAYYTIYIAVCVSVVC